MDELKNTVSILGDEISDFRDRTDDILSGIYEKIEEQEEYIEDLEDALLQTLYGCSVEDITEIGVNNSDARHIHILVNAIKEGREEKRKKLEEIEEQAITSAYGTVDLTLLNDELRTTEDAEKWGNPKKAAESFDFPADYQPPKFEDLDLEMEFSKEPGAELSNRRADVLIRRPGAEDPTLVTMCVEHGDTREFVRENVMATWPNHEFVDIDFFEVDENEQPTTPRRFEGVKWEPLTPAADQPE